MAERATEPVLDQLFRTARTRYAWEPETLSDALMHEIYDLAKWGPTAANSSPARFVFCASAESKAKLAALSSGNNKAKIMASPVTVIIAYDLDFPQTLDKLFPHVPNMKANFTDPVAVETGALRNSSLQGAYLMMAARALDLDCGPMSGFDNAGVDAAFFAGTPLKSNFICSIGHGTDENLFPRLPRHDFDDACKIL